MVRQTGRTSDDSVHRFWYEDFWALYFPNLVECHNEGLPEDNPEVQVSGANRRDWKLSMLYAITLRKLFISDEGWLGLAPMNSVPGDRIALLEGGRVPFILRPTGNENQFEMVGDAYVHGIMDGEAWDEGKDLIDIVLV
ncbi:hypothetical protein GLAREA_06795 [Glarea lozoyensis ATCC 20868]|uniref:Heterokaryon incompatibility protein 6, OR allele n=1 Tax=Glarea lozoyensis (strain ATCC 20868 / MF5171) TaxID=1116229 RepID=S3D5S5_GLAL2|nr:uncharacterized protein GLAREA_06795 [Glarea lozoyensis ATCC 20868]EPE33782.1 hypothetical protein GLAREA_06795 [Glarea lozoyensis ATCC 20868]